MKNIISALILSTATLPALANGPVASHVKGVARTASGSGTLERHGCILPPQHTFGKTVSGSVDHRQGLNTTHRKKTDVVIRKKTDVVIRRMSKPVPVFGEPLVVGVCPTEADRTAYIPLRAIVETLGLIDLWEKDTKVVQIDDQVQAVPTDTVSDPGDEIQGATQGDAQAVSAPTGIQVPTIAILPWRLKDCTDGGMAFAKEAYRRFFVEKGFRIIDDSLTLAAYRQATGLTNPEQSEALLTPKQLLAIGQSLGCDEVCTGEVDWRTATKFVFPRGLVTKAYAKCWVQIVDVEKKALTLDVHDVDADSTNANDLAAVASWVVLGLPNVFGGGPKDPCHRIAGAAAVTKALAGWSAPLHPIE